MMNVALLKNAGVDYDRGVKRFAGRAQLYERTLGKFQRDGTFARIRAAFEAGDRETLLASAHEFKGMCGNIALPTLYEGADALVRMLRAGGYSEEALAGAYSRLAADYQTVYRAVCAAAEDGK